MLVGVEKLHGDLATGSATPIERDRNIVFAQRFAHLEDLGKRRHLEGNVMQLGMLRIPVQCQQERWRDDLRYSEERQIPPVGDPQ